MEQTRSLLDGLTEPRLDRFLRRWPVSVELSAVAPAIRARLPVLDLLSDVHATDVSCNVVIMALQRAAASLVWQQSYAQPEVSETFLRNYAWTAILGVDGPLISERLACGFLLLGPDTFYPAHRHEAEEAYVPLNDGARWRQGDEIWREHPPGTVILHSSEEPHAMHAGARGLLALYLWRSDNLRQRPRLDPERLLRDPASDTSPDGPSW